MKYILTNLRTEEQTVLKTKKEADKIRKANPYCPYFLEKVNRFGRWQVLADGSLIRSELDLTK